MIKFAWQYPMNEKNISYLCHCRVIPADILMKVLAFILG